MQLEPASRPPVGVVPGPVILVAVVTAFGARSESRRARSASRSFGALVESGSGTSNTTGRPVFTSISSNVVVARNGTTMSATIGMRTRPEITWRRGIQ